MLNKFPSAVRRTLGKMQLGQVALSAALSRTLPVPLPAVDGDREDRGWNPAPRLPRRAPELLPDTLILRPVPFLSPVPGHPALWPWP